MRLKRGVTLLGVSPQVVIGLMAAAAVWRRMGQELVVTSVTDGEHKAGSSHSRGMAADLRTRYFPVEKRPAVLTALQEALTSEYQCILEPTHIHMQWKPK